MKQNKKQLKDISTIEVLKQQHKYNVNIQESGGMIRRPTKKYIKNFPFTYEILGKKYGSQKLIYRKMEKLDKQGYLEYGVSLRTSWLTEKGLDKIK